MILIVCVEKNGGMLFFGKRLSRDRILTEKILSETKNSRLVLTPYSAKLFPEAENLVISDEPQKIAAAGDFYFVEDGPFPQDGVDCVYLFHWNRAYPADRFFPMEELAKYFTRSSKEEFCGFSHETITREIYTAKEENK